jgi:hypothetical protein
VILEFINPPILGFLSGKFSCVLYSVTFVGLSTVSEQELVTQYCKRAMDWKTGESDVDLPMVRDFPPLQGVHCGSSSTHTSVCEEEWYASDNNLHGTPLVAGRNNTGR